MNTLRFGHWIVAQKDGGWLATSYSPELGEFRIRMEEHGDTFVILKNGSGPRLICRLIDLAKYVAQVEATGNYVREVFVADVVETTEVTSLDDLHFNRE